jgi:hypothetical protein
VSPASNAVSWSAACCFSHAARFGYRAGSIWGVAAPDGLLLQNESGDVAGDRVAEVSGLRQRHPGRPHQRQARLGRVHRRLAHREVARDNAGAVAMGQHRGAHAASVPGRLRGGGGYQ